MTILPKSIGMRIFLGALALVFAYGLFEPFFTGPDYKVQVGMTVDEAFRSMGRLRDTTVMIHEVPADAKDAKFQELALSTKDDIHYEVRDFTFTPGVTPAEPVKFDSLAGATAELEKRFRARKGSTWSVFTLHMLGVVGRNTYGFRFGPEMRVTSVNPVSTGNGY